MTLFRFVSAMLVALALVFSLIPANFVSAQDSTLTIIASYQDEVLVVRNSAATSELNTLDPQLSTNAVSITVAENLFHGLTDYDPLTNTVIPEIATSWAVTADGLTWTFTLRNDVLWYRYDPDTAIATEIRPVVAADFVYGIKRACDPRMGGAYGYIVAGIVTGCDVVLNASPRTTTDDIVFGDTTQVSAPDDETLVIETQFPAGYFLSMTPMAIFSAVHPETLAEYGENWAIPGNIATNGAYFVQEITPGVRRIFVRNENHNPALGFGGNIDRIEFILIEDGDSGFRLYQSNQIDASNIPFEELENIVNDPEYADELSFSTDLAVFYFGFNQGKPPFDNIHVRRAFSAIIDREAFVRDVRQGRGLPMIHFTPMGIAHAVPMAEVGVGFDPEYAQAEMEAAGYPNCEGFPQVTLFTYTGVEEWIEFWTSAAQDYLGCSPDLFIVTALEFTELLAATGTGMPLKNRPHLWTLGWSSDYPDANNWLRDVLSCESLNAFMRPCSATDDLIDAAARSINTEERDQLYREVEEAFFGVEGEFPVVPLFLRLDYLLIKPWYTGPFDTDGLFGGAHWDAYSIDMAAKLAARGE